MPKQSCLQQHPRSSEGLWRRNFLAGLGFGVASGISVQLDLNVHVARIVKAVRWDCSLIAGVVEQCRG